MSQSATSFTLLPSSLLNDYNEEKLVGNYTLQLVSIRDINKPPYNQENEFLRLDEEPEEGEADETLKGKGFKASQAVKKQNVKYHGPRLLCLNLSDGKNVVKAIEYRYIDSLKPDLPIGTRILIKGPVDVSFKVLLLQSQNIQIMGPPLPGSSLSNTALKPKVESPISITSQLTSTPSTQTTMKSLSQIGSASNITSSGIQSKTQCEEKSIIDISDTTADEHMYYLDGLDDEILE